MALLGLLGALLVGVQFVMSYLPNLEMVSLLVILFTHVFGKKVLFPIYIFVLLEGLLYGFTTWWTTYLYIWTILAGIAWFFRKVESPLMWAVISGAFGLCFGALCEIPFWIIGGWRLALTAWIAGIPFDLVHCAGNFVVALVLYKPLKRVLTILEKKLKKPVERSRNGNTDS